MSCSTVDFSFLNNCVVVTFMVPTLRKKHQGKKVLSKLNDFFNDFGTGNKTQDGVAEGGRVGCQKVGPIDNFRMVTFRRYRASDFRIIESIIAKKVTLIVQLPPSKFER